MRTTLRASHIGVLSNWCCTVTQSRIVFGYIKAFLFSIISHFKKIIQQQTIKLSYLRKEENTIKMNTLKVRTLIHFILMSVGKILRHFVENHVLIFSINTVILLMKCLYNLYMDKYLQIAVFALVVATAYARPQNFDNFQLIDDDDADNAGNFNAEVVQRLAEQDLYDVSIIVLLFLISGNAYIFV